MIFIAQIRPSNQIGGPASLYLIGKNIRDPSSKGCLGNYCNLVFAAGHKSQALFHREKTALPYPATVSYRLPRFTGDLVGSLQGAAIHLSVPSMCASYLRSLQGVRKATGTVDALFGGCQSSGYMQFAIRAALHNQQTRIN